MFCPNCKAILERVRTAYGIQEFCNCPGKKRSEFLGELNKKKLSSFDKKKAPSSSFRAKRKRGFKNTRSTESIKIPTKRKPSDYTNIPITTRIRSNIKLPLNWDMGKVGELLRIRLDETYERFYRKFEDFFLKNNTELQFVVFFEPSPQMNEFKVYRWGIGALEAEGEGRGRLIRWYQGTKLPLDWSAKIREKEGDYITPIINFPESKRKDEFGKVNYLTQIDWFTKLIEFWNEFKDINLKKKYKQADLNEIYHLWRIFL